MSLARNFTIVGSATLASRLTGFARDLLLAAVLGTGMVADAFVAAFLLPNLFRRIVGEGALNAAFVPIHARLEREGGPAASTRFARNALGLMLGFGILITLGALLLMPQIMGVLAPGFDDEPAKLADAIAFGRIAFPFVAIILVVAVFAGTLNALGRYALAAWAPVMMNGLLIVALAAAVVLGWQGRSEAGAMLAWTVLAAGLLQLVVTATGLRRAGRGLRIRWPVFDADLRRFLVIALPGLMIAGAGPLNMLVAAQASTGIPSAVSWLYYADRLFQLPLGFVASAIGVVLLPAVSRALQANDPVGARDAQSRACEFGLLLTLPAAAALFILAQPIVAILFERGAFRATDTAATALSLQALALGLPGFVLVKVLLPAFLARERLTIPVLAAAGGIAANVVMTAWLAHEHGHVAPAISVSISAWVNAAWLAAALAIGREFTPDPLARRRLPRILLASAVTASAVVLAHRLAAPVLASEMAFALRLLALGALCLFGVLTQLGAAYALGAIDRNGLRRWLIRA